MAAEPPDVLRHASWRLHAGAPGHDAVLPAIDRRCRYGQRPNGPLPGWAGLGQGRRCARDAPRFGPRGSGAGRSSERRPQRDDLANGRGFLCGYRAGVDPAQAPADKRDRLTVLGDEPLDELAFRLPPVVSAPGCGRAASREHAIRYGGGSSATAALRRHQRAVLAALGPVDPPRLARSGAGAPTTASPRARPRHAVGRRRVAGRWAARQGSAMQVPWSATWGNSTTTETSTAIAVAGATTTIRSVTGSAAFVPVTGPERRQGCSPVEQASGLRATGGLHESHTVGVPAKTYRGSTTA